MLSKDRDEICLAIFLNCSQEANCKENKNDNSESEFNLTLSPMGSEFPGSLGGGADSAPPMENPSMGCFCQFF